MTNDLVDNQNRNSLHQEPSSQMDFQSTNQRQNRVPKFQTQPKTSKKAHDVLDELALINDDALSANMDE